MVLYDHIGSRLTYYPLEVKSVVILFGLFVVTPNLLPYILFLLVTQNWNFRNNIFLTLSLQLSYSFANFSPVHI